jgi:hypothetical protein
MVAWGIDEIVNGRQDEQRMDSEEQTPRDGPPRADRQVIQRVGQRLRVSQQTAARVEAVNFRSWGVERERCPRGRSRLRGSLLL